MKKVFIVKNDQKRSQLSHVTELLKNEVDFIKINWLLPKDPQNFSSYLRLVILSPFILLYSFFYLIFLRFKSDDIILTSLNSQLTLTLPAKILGFKVYW